MKIEEELQLIKDAGAKICSSKESAHTFLVKLGTHREDGSLHPNYGGEE